MTNITLANGNQIRLFLGDQEVGQIQTLTMNAVETQPVYEMGTPDPRSYIRGQRAKYVYYMDEENNEVDFRFSNDEQISSETLDKLFKSVTMKRKLVNEDYSALLNKGELF